MKWTDDLLNRMEMTTDPPAEAFIEKIVRRYGPEKVKEFFDVLIRNIDMPLDFLDEPWLDEFIATHGTIPPGTDMARVRRGQQVFIDYGPTFVLFLFYKSLPTLYLDRRGVEVLHMTGRLDSPGDLNRFARRLSETAQFLIDAMTPGGLEPGGKGLNTALRVRLIHASVRYWLRSKGWDTEAHQHPINQEDEGLTLMTFSVSMMDAMVQHGIDLSPEEEEDYLYTWKLVGHFIGVHPEMIPRDMSEGRALVARVLERQAGECEAGKRLTEALVAFSDDLSRLGVLDDVARVMIRFYIDNDEHIQMLGIPPESGCIGRLVPKFFAGLVGFGERFEGRAPGIERTMNKLGMGLVNKLIHFMDDYKQRNGEVPEVMRKAWEMD